jgi:lysophospholipase L1-like esterase
MRRMNPGTFVAAGFVLLLLIVAPTRAAEPKAHELKDGDRVAFIGGTFIEREQSYSYLETVLRTRWPERKVVFRNLGWSGDNVFGASRGYFEYADAGFARLTKIVHELKPTVVFVGYGMTESFDGDAGLPTFRTGLEKMLDMLKDLNARETVLIGPIAHEDLGPPLPDGKQHNKWIRAYADAMKEVANARGHRFVDLYDLRRGSPEHHPLTENGVHLTADGYFRAAAMIESQLGLPTRQQLAMDRNGALIGADRLEQIRQLSIQKNIQFFNQWRPANETYIFGFRQKEQGRNAAEMPKFAEPIAKLEDQITKLAQQH